MSERHLSRLILINAIFLQLLILCGGFGFAAVCSLLALPVIWNAYIKLMKIRQG